jgi:choice-of-anchor B domain-containing protein
MVATRRHWSTFALGTAVLLVLAGATPAQAADPSEGTVSLKERTAGWEGQHYPVGQTAGAHTTCQAPTDTICDHFTLNVEINAAHWETHNGGVEITISWPSADDDFDLHVFDENGDEVGHSIAEGTNGERVFISDAAGTYDVRVNPFSVIDSGYDGSVRVDSRRDVGPGGGDVPTEPVFDQRCEARFAGPFPCRNVDLGAFLPHSSIGGGEGNDIWGWTDPATGREYALVGKTNGTAFVDVTQPTAPTYLGLLPSHQPVETIFASWRDVKVYRNHAYVVSEEPTHGMQVFDLTRLRGQTEPQEWTEDAHYPLFGGAHNVAINEETGFAYAIGTLTCQGGPHMVDIRLPKEPAFAGCVDEDGYTHDTQAVIYRGPDARYVNHEILFSSNEDTLTVVDVTDKANPVQLARVPYEGAAYTHQGWLTPNQQYFLLGDELDEQEQGVNTTTYLWDVRNLTNPRQFSTYVGPTEAIDHNLYTKGSRVFEANYRAGLRILDSGKVAAGSLREVGYFDIYPADDAAEFNGAWSNYPYFDSGTVIVSGIEQGLFVLRPTGAAR